MSQLEVQFFSTLFLVIYILVLSIKRSKVNSTIENLINLEVGGHNG